MVLVGQFFRTIDTKHRLAIPSELREGLERMKAGELLYATQGPNDALWLLPEATFEEMAKRFTGSLLPDEEVTPYTEYMFGQTNLVALDKAGRILLPEELLAETAIGTDVAILGIKDHLQIWNAEHWKQEAKERKAKKKELMARAMRAMNNRRSEFEGRG